MQEIAKSLSSCFFSLLQRKQLDIARIFSYHENCLIRTALCEEDKMGEIYALIINSQDCKALARSAPKDAISRENIF